MAIKKEDFVKKMADLFEQAIDKKLNQSEKKIDLISTDRVMVQLPKKLKNREVENELKKRYKKAGWKLVDFYVDSTTNECYAIVLLT